MKQTETSSEVPVGPRFIYDLETNGLLPEVSTIHSLLIKNIDTGHIYSCHDHGNEWDNPREGQGLTTLTIDDGLELLTTATLLIPHNGVNYDGPVLKKLRPSVHARMKGLVRDTLILSRMIWPELKNSDFEREKKLKRRGREWIPKRLFGRHSLEAWGHRLGNHKGDYKGGWEKWSPEMQVYGEQDLEVTQALWDKILKKIEGWDIDIFDGNPAPGRDAIQLEHDVAAIIQRQELHGFTFNEEAASKLYRELLSVNIEIEKKLREVFPPWYRSEGRKEFNRTTFVKRPDLGVEITVPRFSKLGKPLKPYVGPVKEWREEGCQYTAIKLKEFNPGSRRDIADRLQRVLGWKPQKFGQDGIPTVDEEVLSELPWPQAKLLTEYLMVQKRLGQIAEGKEAWLKKVKSDGRIHGSVNSLGAVTRRMTHSGPNIAQVPSGGAPYGHDCRKLFTVPKGKKLVGCDADALELRDLAGYMARFDKGAYIKTVLEGNKALGTDMHTMNAKALSLSETSICTRDTAKTWFYAFIYGSGDQNLGKILGYPGDLMKIGRRARANFLKALPALKKLIDAVQAKAKAQGWIKSLDGWHLVVRSQHSALNTLLQSAGAIQMKRALVILDNALQAMGFVPGVHYEFVANVHDEWQIEVDEDKAEIVGQTAADAIRLAGEYYGFRCPLAGNYDVGETWNDTH